MSDSWATWHVTHGSFPRWDLVNWQWHISPSPTRPCKYGPCPTPRHGYARLVFLLNFSRRRGPLQRLHLRLAIDVVGLSRSKLRSRLLSERPQFSHSLPYQGVVVRLWSQLRFPCDVEVLIRGDVKKLMTVWDGCLCWHPLQNTHRRWGLLRPASNFWNPARVTCRCHAWITPHGYPPQVFYQKLAHCFQVPKVINGD